MLANSEDIITQHCKNRKLLIGADEPTVSGCTGASEAEAHLHLSGVYKSFQHQINDAWGDFLQELGDEHGGWDWFVTLTFRDPDEQKRKTAPTWTKPGWHYAQSALNQFNKAIGKGKPPSQKPFWVAMMEIQKWRGCPHWHMLVGGCGDLRRMDFVDWFWEHYGIARILPYDKNLGARFYLGKYLTKQISDFRTSPRLTRCK
jgi:hypothetical protein